MSGIVDQSDNVHLGGYPGPLRNLTGIWVEEIDALAPTKQNDVVLNDGTVGQSTLLADIIHLETAESLGDYTSNFYQGMPVATKNSFGSGKVYYIGSQLNQALLDNLLNQAIDVDAFSTCVGTKLEVTERLSDEYVYTFIMNFTETVEPLPQSFVGQKDLLTEQIVEEGTTLAPYETFLFKKRTEV